MNKVTSSKPLDVKLELAFSFTIPEPLKDNIDTTKRSSINENPEFFFEANFNNFFG